MSERKPLTLEELRKLYDFSEFIGAHVLLRVGLSEREGVIDYRDDDGICAVYAASGEWLKEKDYGKTWVAYAAEPTILNRSAWDPCCVCSVHHKDWGEYQYGFCPYCGRPLTDSAWEILEKRLEGAAHGD